MRPGKTATEKREQFNIDGMGPESGRIPRATVEEAEPSPAQKNLAEAEEIIIEVSQCLEILRAIDLNILNHPSRIQHLDGVGWGLQSFGALMSSRALEAQEKIMRAKMQLGFVRMSDR